MNRREMLLSGVSIPVVGQTIATDNKAGIVCFISPEEDLNHEQLVDLRRQLDVEEKRTGIKMVLIPAGAEVQAASNAKYGKAEAIGVYSMSAFAETEESLMRIWNAQ